MVCCFFARLVVVVVVVVVVVAAVILVDRRPAMNVFESRAVARNDIEMRKKSCMGKFSKNTRRGENLSKKSGFNIARAHE